MRNNIRPIEILLVEDDRGDQLLASEALDEAKVLNNLHVVENGVEAMAFLRREGKYTHAKRPDLILLDLNLPRKDGREVLKELRLDPRLKFIPVVIMTASQVDEDIIKAYGTPANCYVQKPIDFARFSQVIRSVQDLWFSVVSVPTSARAIPSQSRTTPTGALVELKGNVIRVLLIEDNGTDVVLLKEALSETGNTHFDITHVDRLSKAITELESQRFDVVLTDLGLPDSNGLETVIRTQGAAGETPVIVLTALSDEAVGMKATQAGAEDYIIKSQASGAQVARAIRYAIERRRVEESLRRSEEQFRTSAETLLDCFMIYSAVRDRFGRIIDFRYEFINETGCNMNSRPRGEHIGQSLLTLLPAHRETGLYLEYVRVVETGKPFTREAFLYEDIFGNGRRIARSFDIRAVKLGDGLAVAWRDVTQKVKLEAQFLQAQKMESIGQLAGGIAHDFNNLLTIIQGHASLLDNEDGLSERSLESIQQIAEASERAAELTRQLLAFGRRQVLLLKDLDLNDVVGQMTKMLGRILGEDIGLQIQLAATLPRIRADIGMLEQVVLNLAVNSRDAMPNGGKLSIQTSVEMFRETDMDGNPDASPGQFAALSVTDTGCGIVPEHLGQIFEPFFTTKEVGKGTGLGLASVYGIVKQHHGFIRVRSEVGKGTTIQIFLPSAESKRAPIQPARLEPPKVRGGSETILVVEDEAHLRRLVKVILERHGYHILEAGKGSEALAVWREHREEIQLVVTDMVMPEGMSGKDLIKALSAECPDLRVIYTSGYSRDLFGENSSLKDGVNFLPKPYTPQKLAQMVRAILDAEQAPAPVLPDRLPVVTEV